MLNHRNKIETRKDKYGQNIKLSCSCGIETNWHLEKWKAEKALYENHSDPFRGKSLTFLRQSGMVFL